MERNLYRLRAHHGMCLAFFQGKGYSNDFIQHMAQVQQQLTQNPQVCVMDQLDEICQACPNHEQGVCTDQEKVGEYDRQVLIRCGLEAETLMPYLDFQKLVYERILLPGKREEICGICEWSEMCHFAQDRHDVVDK